MARLLSQQEIPIASAAITRGELVAIPTETVYGLAGNALDPVVVAKIFAAKERPSFDPLIVHVQSNIKNVDDLINAGIVDPERISKNVKNLVNKLIANYWPGPLTIILPKGKLIPDIVTSGLDRVGVRMPAHPVAQELLKHCRLPLAAPSANRFGRVSPTNPNHVEQELGPKIPYILDGGTCEIGVESTVIAVGDSREPNPDAPATIWLIRPGKITKEDLETLSNTEVELAESEHAKASPGMLLSHYAPRKTMVAFHQVLAIKSNLDELIGRPLKAALLVVAGAGELELKTLTQLGIQVTQTANLSLASKDQEAAKNLFSTMRELDESDAEFIIATSVPNKSGLWLAIDDRLKRACKTLKK